MQPDTILTGDSRKIVLALPDGAADLCVTDPPFNIGLDYCDYDDNCPLADYLDQLQTVFLQVHRVLSQTGSLFVAINPERLPDVALLLRELGFHWRNTIVWHYTFGPCQRKKFTPSWVAILYVVKDSQRFTFNADAVRVPSARQTTYGDRRAKVGGKMPDDVWYLRPQDAAGMFGQADDCWHVPRVCGTFKEREKHVCQMPVALLERIIRVASNPGDLVLDPFAGSGTTLIAAQQQGRRYLGVELSEATADLARSRLGGPAALVFSGAGPSDT